MKDKQLIDNHSSLASDKAQWGQNIFCNIDEVVIIGCYLPMMVPNGPQNLSELWHVVSSGTPHTPDYQEAGML